MEDLSWVEMENRLRADEVGVATVACMLCIGSVGAGGPLVMAL